MIEVRKQSIFSIFIGLVLGLVAGFLAANAINRAENLNRASVNNVTPVNAGKENAAKTENEDELSREEIRFAIKQADDSADRIDLQKKLGLALYEYLEAKRNTEFLPDIMRILKRAEDKMPEDFEVNVALGNLHFVLAQEKKKAEDFNEARRYYTKALKTKPLSAEIRTDLGSTYLFAEPPEPLKAQTEYKKALEIDAKNEKALEYLTRALILTKEIKAAETEIEKLKASNPANSALSELQILLEQARIADKS